MSAEKDCGLGDAENKCGCAVVKVGGKPTLSRNWNPGCAEHGTTSMWYTSPEQVTRRAADSERLRDLQRRAREARNASRTDNVDTPT